MGLKELTPLRSLAAFRSGIDATFFQDVGDCRSTNAVADVQQGTLDSSVSPARILASHSDRQFRYGLHDLRPTRGASLVSPFLSDELSVPAKDGVGSYERSNFCQG